VADPWIAHILDRAVQDFEALVHPLTLGAADSPVRPSVKEK
jgi:hypothetical protein